MASHHPAISSQTPNKDSQELLIAPLEGLLLGSRNTVLEKSGTNSTNTGQQSMQVHPTTGGQDQRVTDHDKSHVVDAQICAATVLARENGVREYDCGKLLSRISHERTSEFQNAD